MEHDHRLTAAAIEVIENSLAGMHITLTQGNLPVPEATVILSDMRVIRSEIERAAKRPQRRLLATEFTTIHACLSRLREKALAVTSEKRIVDGILNIDYVLEPTYAAEYEIERKRMGLLSVWAAGHVELDELAFHGIRRMVYRPTPIPPSAAPPPRDRVQALSNQSLPTPVELSAQIADAQVTWRQVWKYAEQLLSCTKRVVIESVQPIAEDPKTLAVKIES